VPALLCAAACTFYNILLKKGSASINPILVGVVLQFVPALFVSLLLGGIVLFIDGGDTSQLPVRYHGPVLSVPGRSGGRSGRDVVLLRLWYGSQRDAEYSSDLGLLILGEKIMWQGWFGVLVLMTGIGFVATDPGEKRAGTHIVGLPAPIDILSI
jgi:drug/metabolite transporter (DMT)-like permease